MSGGISAIRGFDYQATVTLDLLFEHFEKHGDNGLVRPEGLDDLDLIWTLSDGPRRRHVQVKKPTEDILAQPKPSPWTLPNIVSDLLPDAVAKLSGNENQQVWVLGDSVEPRVRALFDAKLDAPTQAVDSYWFTLHGLARTAAVSRLNALPI